MHGFGCVLEGCLCRREQLLAPFGVRQPPSTSVHCLSGDLLCVTQMNAGLFFRKIPVELELTQDRLGISRELLDHRPGSLLAEMSAKIVALIRNNLLVFPKEPDAIVSSLRRDRILVDMSLDVLELRAPIEPVKAFAELVQGGKGACLSLAPALAQRPQDGA